MIIWKTNSGKVNCSSIHSAYSHDYLISCQPQNTWLDLSKVNTTTRDGSQKSYCYQRGQNLWKVLEGEKRNSRYRCW